MSEECLLFDESIIADSSDRAMYRAVHGSNLEGLLNSKSPHGRKETPPKQAVADARGCKPMMLTRWTGHKKTEENTCLLGLPADDWEILVCILSGSLNCFRGDEEIFISILFVWRGWECTSCSEYGCHAGVKACQKHSRSMGRRHSGWSDWSAIPYQMISNASREQAWASIFILWISFDLLWFADICRDMEDSQGILVSSLSSWAHVAFRKPPCLMLFASQNVMFSLMRSSRTMSSFVGEGLGDLGGLSCRSCRSCSWKGKETNRELQEGNQCGVIQWCDLWGVTFESFLTWGQGPPAQQIWLKRSEQRSWDIYQFVCSI